MIPRWLVLVAVAACRGKEEQPPAPTAPPPRSAYGQVCPIGILSTKPWAHEVFPGCTPPQLGEDGLLCDGSCPQPCQRTTRMQDLPPHAYDLTYDARGHLVSARDPSPTGTELTYAYTGDQLSACSSRDGTCELQRDGRGRLVRGRIGDDWENFSYDAAGDLVEIDDALLGHSTLIYDAWHRIVSERISTDELTYHYDDRGRVTGDTVNQHVAATDRYEYDANQRRARIVASGRDGDDTAAITYDARGRPVHYVRSGTLRGEPMEFENTRFDYCDPMPSGGDR